MLDLIQLNNIAFSDIVCRFLSLKMILAGFPQEEKFPRNLPTCWERNSGLPFAHGNRWYPSIILEYGQKSGRDFFLLFGECYA